MVRARRVLVIVALLAVSTFGALWSASPASAVSPVSASIGIDHNGGVPNINSGPALLVEGSSVDIGLITKATSPGLGAWTIDVHFDLAVVDATACLVAPLPPPGASVCNPDYPLPAPADIARIAGAYIGGVVGTFKLMDVTFEASVGASPGDCSDLRVDVVELADKNSENITDRTVSNGSICIVACADVTGDGIVTIPDVVRILLRVVLHRPYDAAFDLNDDGRVNLADIFIAAGELGKTC